MEDNPRPRTFRKILGERASEKGPILLPEQRKGQENNPPERRQLKRKTGVTISMKIHGRKRGNIR